MNFLAIFGILCGPPCPPNPVGTVADPTLANEEYFCPWSGWTLAARGGADTWHL